MATEKALLNVRVARRIPDPNFADTHGIERHLFVVPVWSVPPLPLDPNARQPRTSKRVYKKVQDSLFDRECEPGTFHLKNKGITVIANRVNKLDNDNYEIEMTTGIHGIVDGGHTHKIIVDGQKDPEMPTSQFVNIEVRVGVPESWITEIAGGLNTSVQVQDMSLDNLAYQFEWLKDILRDAPYYRQIAWSENDAGEFDARDIISLLTLFNIDLFPNSGDDHPVYAYEKKSQALKEFERNGASFKHMRGMVRDILTLHDTIRRDYRDIWNKGTGGSAKALAFSEGRDNGNFEFPFTQKLSDVRMYPGALYPILAAFRWFVVKDKLTGEMRWRTGFGDVLNAWHDAALPLLKATVEMSNSLGRNPQSVGKSRPHWGNLHNVVAKKDLERLNADLTGHAHK